jgi:hypothetical protein
LLEGFLRDGYEEDGVGAEVVLCGGFDGFDYVACFGEVDECLGGEFVSKGGSAVDGMGWDGIG